MSLKGLYAVAPPDGDWFTLYAENKELESYGLPKHKIASGTAAKVLLTPVAVAGDATFVGCALAVIAQSNSDSDEDVRPPRHKKPKPSQPQ